MRIIVCGGRDYGDASLMRGVLEAYADRKPVIVHGDSPGADRLAGELAHALGCLVEAYPADWERHGRAAGPIRNQGMVGLGADLCIAFPGGKGTEDMVRRARVRGIPVLRVADIMPFFVVSKQKENRA